MKVEQKKEFAPIVITIENEKELNILNEFLFRITPDLWRALAPNSEWEALKRFAAMYSAAKKHCLLS